MYMFTYMYDADLSDYFINVITQKNTYLVLEKML